MSYNYAIERPFVLTDEGQRVLLKMRDLAFELCGKAGAVRADKLMVFSGNSWQIMACIDRLVEVGDLREIQFNNGAWQRKVFTLGREQ